jgi:hypothetical protein
VTETVSNPPVARAEPDAASWRTRAIALLAFGAIAAQVGVLARLIGHYQIQSRTFHHLALAGFAGFVVHHLLPRPARLPFFLLLSLAATAWVLGIEGAQFRLDVSLERTLLLLAVGGALIAICRLPFRYAVRVALLVAAGAALAVAQVRFADAPLVGAIGPVLGAMFMFRIALYLYDTEHDPKPPGVVRSLAYFFMLPNVFFTLFPVVDYKAFARGHYSADALAIYQRGVRWIARGLLQILAWRLVYYHVHVDPGRVRDGAELVQFLVSNVLLYLRVAGSFHLIVGVLHLFGFVLPVTNRRFFLAESFNDYWRRVNIYYKDFIMKVIYYPITFRLKAWGTTKSLVVATSVAFALTWLLHSYQLFWLRGEFPIQAQEAVFWGALGALVVVNSLWEMRPGRRAPKRNPTPRYRIGRALRTAGTFAVITLLWSVWNTDSLAQWASLWSHADASTLGWSAVVLLVVALASIPFGGDAGMEPPLGAVRRAKKPPTRAERALELVRLHGPLATLLAVTIASRFATPWLGPEAQVVVSSLTWTRPNAADGEREALGYYDNAIEVSRFNRSLGDAMGGPPAHWQRVIEETEAAVATDHLPLAELVPSRETIVNGTPMRTNAFGQRDREYERAKPPNTFRIALIGSSPEMGWCVGDAESYQALVEERLAREQTPRTGLRYEILNFGVNGLSAIEQPAAVRDQVAGFAPDAVLYGAHGADRYYVMTRLGKAVRAGVPLEDAYLTRLLAETRIDARTPETWALRRLSPRVDDLLLDAYRATAEAIRAIGARPIWLWVPLPRGSVPAEGVAMGALAEQAGFAIFSLEGAYGDTDPETLSVATWDGHPNARGHRLLADKLYQVLTSAVAGPIVGWAAPAASARSTQP